MVALTIIQIPTRIGKKVLNNSGYNNITIPKTTCNTPTGTKLMKNNLSDNSNMKNKPLTINTVPIMYAIVLNDTSGYTSKTAPEIRSNTEMMIVAITN